MSVYYPVVLGKDDYTKHLAFYVEHIAKEQPMNIDNIDMPMSFINCCDAGKFLAYLCDKNFTGSINGASNGSISIRQIIEYVGKKLEKKAIILKDGENAPYNATPEFSLSIERAEKARYDFLSIDDWILELLDYYISLN